MTPRIWPPDIWYDSVVASALRNWITNNPFSGTSPSRAATDQYILLFMYLYVNLPTTERAARPYTKTRK